MALYVGIDVSKEKLDACGIGDQGKKVFSLSCSMNREGFDKFVLQLAARSTASLLLGMESTANYHIALVAIGCHLLRVENNHEVSAHYHPFTLVILAQFSAF